jgi:hypothetical protein
MNLFNEALPLERRYFQTQSAADRAGANESNLRWDTYLPSEEQRQLAGGFGFPCLPAAKLDVGV